MQAIMKTLMALIMKVKNLTLEYFFVLIQWFIKLGKVQMQKMKRTKNLKHLEKANSVLGAEVFALMKDGETGWQGSPAVENSVTKIEQAEAKVFEVDDAIEQLNETFRQKREQIKNKYTATEEPAAEEV